MGQKPSRATILNQVNKMTAKIIVNISLNCNSGVNSQQTIKIQCDPGQFVDDNINEYAVELSDGCRKCYSSVVEDRLSYYALQKAEWDREVTIKKPIDLDFRQAINEFVACGRGPCKACHIEDLNQDSLVKSIIGCQGANNIQNQLTQQLMTSVTQQLTNNQDMLSGLADILGGGSTQNIIMNVTNRISSRVTENVVNNIKQQISTQQTMNITMSNGSVKGISQNSAIHSVTTFFEKTGIFNTILSDEQWKTLESLVNNQNTIGELGGLGVGTVSTFSKMMKSIVGKVLLFVIVMVCVLFVLIVIYVITNFARKEIAEHEESLLKGELATQQDLALEEY